MSNKFEDLLSEYWDAAYAEGSGGRSHDTQDGRAQRALSALCEHYAALLARHNALREAVAWERECDYLWEFGPVLSNIANDELLWSMKRARADVDRLIGEGQ